MIFVTADAHLGHANIIKYSNRPFQNVNRMNEEITDRWNSVVMPRDTVFHVGDFCFGDPEPFVKNLNGYKVFLIGSHDEKLHTIHGLHDCTVMEDRIFSLRTAYKSDGHSIYLHMCHWAMRSWPESHYGSWHVYGHHHGRLKGWGKSFDIGMDCWNFQPVPMNIIKEKMDSLTDPSIIRRTQ